MRGGTVHSSGHSGDGAAPIRPDRAGGARAALDRGDGLRARGHRSPAAPRALGRRPDRPGARGLDAHEPPSRLLAVAAAASLYGRVGRKPAIDPSPPPEICPPDARPECSEPQANRLRTMLRGEHSECLPEWMELLSASGRRLPFDAIVDVLGRNELQNEPADTLRTVLGVRGRWLAAKNPKWRKYAGVQESAEPASVWETGTIHERVAALESLRGTDPGRARELVASTFAADSADHRARFVAAFVRGLSMEDEPFLEAALDDRSKEVRRQAAELLRSLPESRLCLRMIERARAALRWEGGTLVVEPPASCDKATDPRRRGAEAGGEHAARRAGLVAAGGRVGRSDEGDRRAARA